MEKKFNSRTIAQVKSIFKFNEKNYNDLAKLNAKIAKLEEQRDTIQQSIDLAEQPILNMLGYKSGDLIEVVVTPLFNEDGTPKMDAEGKYQQKKKQYVCKYGDAFLPPVADENPIEENPMPMTEMGNDFDKEAEALNNPVEEPTL